MNVNTLLFASSKIMYLKKYNTSKRNQLFSSNLHLYTETKNKINNSDFLVIRN